MTDLHSHRKVAAETSMVFSLQPPFSFFDFAEQNFDFCESIRRVFSLARSFDAKTLVLEKIPPVGMIAEENEDILSRFPHYTCEGLFRLSFWFVDLPTDGVDGLNNDDLIGYAIFKKDITRVLFDNRCIDGWHVFEAVLCKYPHPNNCTPHQQTYSVAINNNDFEINGLLYCQQNSFSKACAQVAMRSLLSRILPEGDISYRQINQLAETVSPGFDPRGGLSVPQMRGILENLGVLYSDVDYSIDPAAPDKEKEAEEKKQLTIDLPYQKYAYAGLESGGGALVGFRFKDADGNRVKDADGNAPGHIIPIYGHTFNKDTWAPAANFAYFKIGDDLEYIPSESWTSSFIAHDDNFGPNYCIPRLYMQNDSVDYILEIFRPGITYSGVLAEALALNIAYPLLESLSDDSNVWIARLKTWLPRQRIVFRAQALKREEYVDHLRSITDWEGVGENPEICDFLEEEIADYLWVVEVSTPHLFPANKRKIGEIVLSGVGEVTNEDESLNNDLFVLARLPELYVLGGDLCENGIPEFTKVASHIGSHTSLLGC